MTCGQAVTLAVSDVFSPFSTSLGMSLNDIIGKLPTRNCSDYLVSHFFIHISAWFPILYGPTFQKQYAAFMQQPCDVDISWLTLLFSICSLVLNTMEGTDPRLTGLRSVLFPGTEYCDYLPPASGHRDGLPFTGSVLHPAQT